MIKKFFSLLIALHIIFIPLVGHTAQFHFSEERVSLRADRGDFYGFSSDITLSQSAPSDVIVAGSQIAVNAPIADNLMAAGVNVSVFSPVGGSARIIGSNIIISSSIGRDLVLAAASVTMNSSTDVLGETYVAASDIVLEGKYRNAVRIRGERVELNGLFERPVTVYAKEVKLGENAQILQGISVFSPEPMKQAKGAEVLGPVNYTATAENRGDWIFVLIFGLISLLSWYIAAWVAGVLFPSSTAHMRQAARHDYWQFFAKGITVMVVSPIIGFIALITGIGAIIGIAILLGWMGIFLLGLISAPHFALGFARPQEESTQYAWPLFAATTVYRVIVSLPIVGWIISMAVIFPTVGHLIHRIWGSIKRKW